jgi:uncharacterized protein YlxW (UPF0749 family)
MSSVFLSTAVFFIAVWLFVLTFNLRKLQTQQSFLVKEAGGGDFLKDIDKRLSKTEEMDKKIQKLDEKEKILEESLKSVVQNVSVVRFDAFEDTGGKLSFAVALLNEHGNGLVISCINGRQESRTYAKPIIKGKSSFTLSGEEEEAIKRSMSPKSFE